MNLKILGKFVKDGIQKNRKSAVPFLIANVVIVTIFFILVSLAFTPFIYDFKTGKEAFYGGQTLSILLELSVQIVTVFAAIFVLYANHFVMRNRRREIGLYGILGLSQKHITLILVMDMCVKSAISIGMGMLCGTFLNKLTLLLLYKIIHQPPVSGMMIVPRAFVQTLMVFGIIDLICLIHNVISVNVGNPVELLRSDKVGEREPKVKVGMLIVGILMLAAGYLIACRCESSMQAIAVIVPAVLLVIGGTYFLFISGSIFILKMLRKNKAFYYKTKNFISVSNLMYRMKHNAAGLASICVLSTAVLILLTSAASLTLLGEKNINRMFPQDIKVEAHVDKDVDPRQFVTALESAEAQVKTTFRDIKCYRYVSSAWAKTDDPYAFESMGDGKLYGSVDDMVDVYLLTLSDYNQYTGQTLALDTDEVLIHTKDADAAKSVDLLNHRFRVAGGIQPDRITEIIEPSMELFDKLFVVVADEAVMKQVMESDLLQEDAGKDQSYYKIYAGAQSDQHWSKAEMEDITHAIADHVDSNVTVEVKFKQEQQAFFYNIYGGIFFVGIFLAVLFLLATVLIIYYKQISEGFEDQKHYEILACVGLTEEEIRATIRRQVMILFFLPVVTAIIHMAVASHIVRLFLATIMVVDAGVFFTAMAIVCVIFLGIYAVVYKVTSREYFKIVYAGK